MSSPGYFRHGGRMGEAAVLFPNAPLPWIDLSTGINPHSWTGPRADFSALQRLPDPAETTALEAAAAASFGVHPAMVAAIPGAEAGLRLLPRLTSAPDVGILSPTYGGHAEAWHAAGRLVHTAVTLHGRPETSALVIVNPNNPDGRQIPPETLAGLVSKRRLLIVDESFGEVTPQLSVASRAHDRLIVLRSFGKFFGLAGVRLGFIVAGPRIIAGVRAAFGDWPVSAEALAAGTAAYADADWADATRTRLQQDSDRLDTMLVKAGLGLLGGTSLFRLAACPHAAKWFEHLARHGLLIRPFGQQPDWLRFGLPGSEAAWSRLQIALEHGIA
ncbi:threonine-phosphate decarboxylase CobD [Acidocella aquatica]|nr:threonine-phosphate decarboxylase CobD [Acidocella aquatica]